MRTAAATLILILFFAAILRAHTFYLPHNHGDQVLYLGLAMKMEDSGLGGYNLRGIDVVEKEGLLFVQDSADKEKGTLLAALEKAGVFYYSGEKVSNMPPAFSYLLMLSHKLFNKNGPYSVVNKNLGARAILMRPKIFLYSQFYAAWINFIFSLLFILLTFVLGKMFFGEIIGLWASLFLAVSPLDLLVSQRIWSDHMASFFTILSVLFFWQSIKKNSLKFLVLSGASSGIAAISKQSGIFIIFMIIFSDILIKYHNLGKISLNLVFNKRLLVFILSAFAVCGFWYVKITMAYGAPWYIPYQRGVEKASAWFAMLSRRPRYGQLYYFVYLMPLFIFFYFELFFGLLKKIFSPERLICAVWFLLFLSLLIVISAKEERYMLPAYPPIAFFSALFLERARKKMNYFHRAGDITVAIIFTLAAARGITIAFEYIFNNSPIFFI